MLKHLDYQSVRAQMQPGDVIAFGGNSLFSRWTKLTTRSVVTHVAVVMQTKMLDESSNRYFNQVCEATCYNGRKGVMTNRLSERVQSYDGDIWWLPLGAQARQNMNQNKKAFFDFLFQQQHGDYDIWQLFGAAVDVPEHLPLLRSLAHNQEEFSAWFCSELVSQGLEQAKVLHNVNASEVTPIDLCRFNVYDSDYVQIKGEVTPISGINSMDATDWGALC